jgi:hypothetical protein
VIFVVEAPEMTDTDRIPDPRHDSCWIARAAIFIIVVVVGIAMKKQASSGRNDASAAIGQEQGRFVAASRSCRRPPCDDKDF